MRRGKVERRVLGQDRLLQATELDARLHPDLLDQHGARLAVGVQRLGLAAGAIERQHALRVQPLVQRMRADQRLELADHLVVAAFCQVGVDRLLGRAHAQLVQPSDLGGGERLVGHVGERLAVPQRERLACATAFEQTLELDRIHGTVGHPQLVAPAAGDDLRAVALEQPTQLRHVQLHHLRRAGGRFLAPQPLGKPVGRHRPAGLEPEHRQHRPLLGGAERDRALVAARLDRPKEAQIHAERRRSGHVEPTLLPVEDPVNRVSTLPRPAPISVRSVHSAIASKEARMSSRPHQLARLLTVAVTAAALAAPPALARPLDGPNEPVRPDPFDSVAEPPVVQQIDDGFDWGSAAIGAGGAGAIVVLISLGGVAYSSRHRVHAAP